MAINDQPLNNIKVCNVNELFENLNSNGCKPGIVYAHHGLYIHMQNVSM